MAFRFSLARNCHLALLVTAVIVVAPMAASAQDPGPGAPKQQKKLPEPPGKLPKVGADKTRGLDFLFGALKAAPDDASAKRIAKDGETIWNKNLKGLGGVQVAEVLRSEVSGGAVVPERHAAGLPLEAHRELRARQVGEQEVEDPAALER